MSQHNKSIQQLSTWTFANAIDLYLSTIQTVENSYLPLLFCLSLFNRLTFLFFFSCRYMIEIVFFCSWKTNNKIILYKHIELDINQDEIFNFIVLFFDSNSTHSDRLEFSSNWFKSIQMKQRDLIRPVTVQVQQLMRTESVNWVTVAAHMNENWPTVQFTFLNCSIIASLD